MCSPTCWSTSFATPFHYWSKKPLPADLEHQLVSEILETGPIPFAAFVERALYDHEFGFYSVRGQAGGRRGDFVTSVEVGPLFAAVIADWLDGIWRQLGAPTPFRVSEVGAGVGTLFRGINRAGPDCFDALRYTLVERSSQLRVEHQSLPTDCWQSEGTLPGERQHVILANELLDNLAFGIAKRVGHGWAPVQVAVVGDALVLQPGGVDATLDRLNELVPNAASGVRVPIADEASQWVQDARAKADRVLVFDYGAPTAELADRTQAGWLRTYVGHTRGSDPLLNVGMTDITHDVPIDQLPTPQVQQTQAEWLRANGIDGRVDAARRTWAERAHIGDLQAIAARSAIGEAEALCDPTGLGGFVALGWSGT